MVEQITRTRQPNKHLGISKERSQIFLASEFYEVASLALQFLEYPPEEYNVFIVTTASRVAYKKPPLAPDELVTNADKWRELEWLEKTEAAFKDNGFQQITFTDVKGIKEEELQNIFGSSDASKTIIFLCGGNTFELSNEEGLRNFLPFFMNDGGLVFGSSAGPVWMLSENLIPIKHLDSPYEEELQFTEQSTNFWKGFNLLNDNTVVLPHWNRRWGSYRLKNGRIQLREIPVPYSNAIQEAKRLGLNILYLTNDQAIIKTGENYEVIAKGNGTRRQTRVQVLSC